MGNTLSKNTAFEKRKFIPKRQRNAGRNPLPASKMLLYNISMRSGHLRNVRMRGI